MARPDFTPRRRPEPARLPLATERLKGCEFSLSAEIRSLTVDALIIEDDHVPELASPPCGVVLNAARIVAGATVDTVPLACIAKYLRDE